MPTIDLWMCQHLQCLPSTRGELLYAESVCIILFALIASITTRPLGKANPELAIACIIRNGIAGGATFSFSVLLALYPFSQNVRQLFSFEPMTLVMVLAGGGVATLQVYALLRLLWAAPIARGGQRQKPLLGSWL